LQTVVRKWFRDKASGLLENGSGPNIIVRKIDLINCQFLKVGATVQFECHLDKQGLIAKKVKLLGQNKSNKPKNKKRDVKKFPFGVMT
jgi:cold shock CspA family protein